MKGKNHPGCQETPGQTAGYDSESNYITMYDITALEGGGTGSGPFMLKVVFWLNYKGNNQRNTTLQLVNLFLISEFLNSKTVLHVYWDEQNGQ